MDLDEQLLALPPERVKTGHAHVVPLSPPAVALLEQCPRFVGCDFVLTTNGRTAIRDWNGATAKAKALSGTAAWTAHDLRRTCATTLARLGTGPHVVEAVLGHLPPRIARIYVRHDFAVEKRRALDTWAEHVMRVVAGAPK